MFGAPNDRFRTDDVRNPNLWPWFLHRQDPWVDETIVVVFTFVAPGSGCSPRFDHKIVCFVKTLTVEGRVGVVGDRFAAGAANPAGHQAAAGDYIDHGKFFSQAQRI